MYTLLRGRKGAGEAGEPLPEVFPKLGAASLHFRRGQFHLVAAAPGVGKSLLAMTLALGIKLPAFYFSADSDAFTMYVRTAARQTRWTTEEVEDQVRIGNTQLIDAEVEKASRHIRWSFDTNPDFDTIEQELLAYCVTYGCWPALIVVDNVSNAETDSGEGQVALESICEYLHSLARTTGACVVGLHHVTGIYDDGMSPVPLSGLRGKISKIPEVVLTLFRNPTQPGSMGVCVVKNRGGKADPSGATVVFLQCELERMMLQ